MAYITQKNDKSKVKRFLDRQILQKDTHSISYKHYSQSPTNIISQSWHIPVKEKQNIKIRFGIIRFPIQLRKGVWHFVYRESRGTKKINDDYKHKSLYTRP